MTATDTIVYSGEVHSQGGKEGFARSKDGELDIIVPEPHPFAERMFASAWSACFMAAIQGVAAQKKIKLPSQPEMETKIDLHHAGGLNYFLSAQLNVRMPGLDRKEAEGLVEAAHGVCPYSKATSGNIEVALKVID